MGAPFGEGVSLVAPVGEDQPGDHVMEHVVAGLHDILDDSTQSYELRSKAVRAAITEMRTEGTLVVFLHELNARHRDEINDGVAHWADLSVLANEQSEVEQ